MYWNCYFSPIILYITAILMQEGLDCDGDAGVAINIGNERAGFKYWFEDSAEGLLCTRGTWKELGYRSLPK